MSKSIWMIAAMVGCVFVAGNARAAGGLTPTNAPAPSMRSLDEIYQKVNFLSTNVISIVVSTNLFQSFSNSVAKTGQSNSYNTAGTLVVSNRDDGDLKRGVAPPVPRFTDNGNGTVTDNMTGLIWLKISDPFGGLAWSAALTNCTTLNSGEHGLSDGSVEGDWRLPNVRELFSLLNYGTNTPALPVDHPFTYTPAPGFWTSTTYVSPLARDLAYSVNMDTAFVYYYNKTTVYAVWPVRGGP